MDYEEFIGDEGMPVWEKARKGYTTIWLTVNRKWWQFWKPKYVRKKLVYKLKFNVKKGSKNV